MKSYATSIEKKFSLLIAIIASLYLRVGGVGDVLTKILHRTSSLCFLKPTYS